MAPQTISAEEDDGDLVNEFISDILLVVPHGFEDLKVFKFSSYDV